MNTTTFLLCGALALGSSVSTHAFMPDEQGHLGISRSALTDSSVTRVVDGTTLTFTKTAIDQILRANEETDAIYNQPFSEIHFDDENFYGGCSRLILLRTQIISNILKSDPDGYAAREDLGGALHTLQDFYSHSSWVELGNLGINPDLGRSLMSNPSTTAAVSALDALGIPREDILGRDGLPSSSTPTLTSGYFLAALCHAPSNKVRHGFALNGCPTGLNKDEPDYGGGIPGQNYYPKARQLAVKASVDFLQQILNAPGVAGNRKAISALMGLSNVGFVIDTTGSMALGAPSTLELAKQYIRDLVNLLSAPYYSYPPSEYLLQTFNDPDVPEPLITTNAQEFLSWIPNIFAGGGGDCPEPAMTALLKAVKAAQYASVLWFFSDASAKDSFLDLSVSTEAQKKKIKINFLLTGSCSPVDPGYVKIAEQTGGRLFFVPPTALASAFELVRPQSSEDFVTIFSIADDLAPDASREFLVPVDSTLSNLTFSIVTGGGGLGMTVTDPAGVGLGAGQPGVKVLSTLSGQVMQVAVPVPGQWRMRVTGSGHFSATVTGNSPIQSYAC